MSIPSNTEIRAAIHRVIHNAVPELQHLFFDWSLDFQSSPAPGPQVYDWTLDTIYVFLVFESRWDVSTPKEEETETHFVLRLDRKDPTGRHLPEESLAFRIDKRTHLFISQTTSSAGDGFFPPARVITIRPHEGIPLTEVTLDCLAFTGLGEHGAPPRDWYRHHHPGCGTEFRGCHPDCPKDRYEQTGIWKPL